MDLIKENIIKFIDAMIVDNYSKAHKFLEVVVQENVKKKIEKAKNLKPFGKGKSKDKPDKKKKGKKELPDFIKKLKEKKSKSKK
jgi:hypothetical protein